MNQESRIDSHPSPALVRAEALTTELIELVGKLRAALASGEERSSPETPAVGDRLKSGDLRAAMSGATRSARPVPHLFG